MCAFATLICRAYYIIYTRYSTRFLAWFSRFLVYMPVFTLHAVVYSTHVLERRYFQSWNDRVGYRGYGFSVFSIKTVGTQFDGYMLDGYTVTFSCFVVY